MKRHLLAAALMAASAAHAWDLTLDALSQEQFQLVSKDLSSALSFQPILPAAPLGIIGFDVGLGVSATKLNSVAALKAAAGVDAGDVPDTLPTVSLRAHKGLPFDIDVGAAYTMIPATKVKALSAEVRWAVLGGSLVTPAVGTRLYVNKMQGVDAMDLQSVGADVSISKGFLNITPYGGVGILRTQTSATNAPSLVEENFNQTRTFVGANLNLLLLNLAAEVNKTGDNTSYSVKLGLRF